MKNFFTNLITELGSWLIALGARISGYGVVAIYRRDGDIHACHFALDQNTLTESVNELLAHTPLEV